MKLIYLWVEEYKNIKNQGFNFSPSFECEFKAEYVRYIENGEEKEKLRDDCELKIIPKDYVSIFHDNINITAIVGENGSGKSSVLESLSDLLSESYSRNYISQNNEYNKYVLIYEIEGQYYFLKNHIQESINLIDKFNNKINWIIENPNKEYLLTRHRNLIALIIDNQIKYKKIYGDYDRVFVENTQNDTTRIKKIIINNLLDYKETIFRNDNDKFFIPKKVIVKIKNYNLFTKDKENYEEDIWSKIEELKIIIEEGLVSKNYKTIFENIIKILKIKKEEHKKVPFLMLNSDSDIKDSFYFHRIYNYASKLNQNNYDLNNIYINQLKKLSPKPLNKDIFYEWEINELDKDMTDFIFDLPEIAFDIQLKDDNKDFESLSYGETQLIAQLNFILFHSKKRIYTEELLNIIQDEEYYEQEVTEFVDFQIENMIVLLDEFELGLHPNWQKKSIIYLINFLKLFKTKFHIIITSHSPFILSDLAKENLIFLEKYNENDDEVKKQNQKIGNCKNVTKDIELKTFGANIHTLLSDGFFMSDGLMGEFAKSKITKILRFLNYDNKFIDISQNTKIPFLLPKDYLAKKLKPIIESIGEDFLRNKLLTLYRNKFIKDEKEKEKNILKNKIEELLKQYDELNK